MNVMRLMKSIYPKRNPWSKKGDYGYVLVVGGCPMYSGAPALNALAALRAGADLSVIAGLTRAMNIAATFAPDLITIAFDDLFARDSIKEIVERSKKFDALVIGSGMARSQRSSDGIRALIRSINLPMVIDAEAIRAVAGHTAIIRGKTAILTPHEGEFKALTGQTVNADMPKRGRVVKRWAQKLRVVILLKGHVDVISDGKEVHLNKTGSPFMTKGGTGDVLAGICSALLARGVKPYDAAVAGAWINGKAGERAARKFGEGMFASDLVDCIPSVILRHS